MKTQPFEKIIIIFLLLIFVIIFWDSFSKAMDEKIDSENKMLCESALVSGNREYQNKCKPYYKTGDITLLRSGGSHK